MGIAVNSGAFILNPGAVLGLGVQPLAVGLNCQPLPNGVLFEDLSGTMPETGVAPNLDASYAHWYKRFSMGNLPISINSTFKSWNNELQRLANKSHSLSKSEMPEPDSPANQSVDAVMLTMSSGSEAVGGTCSVLLASGNGSGESVSKPSETPPWRIEELIDNLWDSDLRVNARNELVAIGEAAIPHLVEKGLGVDYLHEFAEGVLADIGKPAIEPLFEALELEGKTAMDAVKALWFMGGDEVISKAIAMVKDDEFASSVRARAVHLLGKLRIERAVDVLIDASKDESPEVRWYAVDSLCWIKGEETTKHILLLLKDEDAHVRKRAVEAIPPRREEFFELLVGMLSDASGEVRREAMRTLSLSDYSQFIEHIIEVLGDSHANTQFIAFETIRDHTPLPTSQLIEALKNKNPLIRKNAARILGEKGDPSVIAHLIESIFDPDPSVTDEAVKALSNKGHFLADQLIDALDHSSAHVRKAAAKLLNLLAEKGPVKI